MDINSLLSPQEPSSRNTNSQQAQPSTGKRGRPEGGKRTASALSQEVIFSPSPDPPKHAPAYNAAHGYESVESAQQRRNHHSQQPLQHQWSNHPTPYNGTSISRDNTPLSDVNPSLGPTTHQSDSQAVDHRKSSTPQMETLADVASMQQHQQPRSSLTPMHNAELTSAPISPLHTNNRKAPPNIRTHSASDLVMAEAPSQTPPPRVYTATSISDADLGRIGELTQYLADNSYDYNSHVELINLLHQGLLAYATAPAGDTVVQPIPADYNLLPELRQARDAMTSRFAVGENLWLDWIQDESMLAKTSEERSAVMELCIKAVEEEPTSTSLWKVYGEWVWSTYAVANGFSEGDAESWTEEDRMICREVFSRELVLSVWEQAVNATKWRIDNSHLVWNRYVELIMQDFPEKPAPQTIEEMRILYLERLQVPHPTWSETSSQFWSFISRYDSDWESIMAAMNEMAAPAKQQYALREDFELNMKRASETNDQTSLFDTTSSYLGWEAKHKKKIRKFDSELRVSMYERALLRFPTMIEWWLDYADYLTTMDPGSHAILTLLERATRHCPWSGDLWSRRLLRTELEKADYAEVENVKHKATNSGLLVVGGMEEMLLVFSSWCSYLRRRAFEQRAEDDDIDMAEMAISDVLRDVQITGKKTYGETFKGDPLWRIEKIFIKFLTQARRFDEARQQWRIMIPAQGHSYDFWAHYYNWEIFVWGVERTVNNAQTDTNDRCPRAASAVLREAMSLKELDWPEKIHELFAHHFQEHEMPEEVQKAQVELRAAQKRLKYRRDREAEAAAEAAGYTQQTEQPVTDDQSASGKRKREDEIAMNGDDTSTKRSKVEDHASVEPPYQEVSASASAQIKRDREHNTVTVQNLPPGTSESVIRQFFADCGNIMSVAMIEESNNNSVTATIEFESHEDVLAARTRDGKPVGEQTIRVGSGSQSTLYVTNYPADWDEVKVREMFSGYGEIISVRFPSLKYDQRRRFCYIQFLTHQEAIDATALDGKAIDGLHTLSAKISDPEAKKRRAGATAEGREVIVKNIDFTASEAEIKGFFETSGEVDSIRRLKKADGNPTGTAFIVFVKPESAQAALLHNNKPLKSRILHVELTVDKKKGGGPHVIRHTAESASPAPEETINGRRPSTASQNSRPAKESTTWNQDTASTRKQRTFAVLNLPDTVNSARIESFFSSYGSLKKILMNPDRGGALIEFENLADAGKVGMGVDCSALGEACRLGEAGELYEKKSKGRPLKAEGSSNGGSIMRPAQAGVSRPAQRGGKRGGRGGLGFKRDGFGSGSAPQNGADKDAAGVKSNADFRNMFVKSGEASSASDNGAEGPKDG